MNDRWLLLTANYVIGASRSEAPHYWVLCIPRYIIYVYIYIYIYPYDLQAIAHASNVSRKTWRRCSAHYVYAIAKKKKLWNRCFATATDINGCSVARSIEVTMVGTLDRSRLPRSAIMAAQVQSTDVFLCYQRLRVSCALCNNFQAARPRQTTERRLAPLYDKS